VTTRLTRRQLIAFAIVTIAAVALMSAQYIKLPALLGIGQYQVSVDLANTGGLYPKAKVSYRGVDVGEVTSIDLTSDGVQAHLSISDGTSIPKDSLAEVHSTSAIGELYVDFVPRGTTGGTAGGMLADGDVVPVSDTTLPQPTGKVVDQLTGLLKSVPTGALRSTVNELGTALAGRGADIGSLINNASSFQDAADQNLPQTKKLIADLGVVLGTQNRLKGQTVSLAHNLGNVTGTLAKKNSAFAGILHNGGPAANQLHGLVNDLSKPLPQLLTDLASTAAVLKVYVPSIEHVFTVLPGIVALVNAATHQSASASAGAPYPMGNLSFRTNFNDPPACNTGFVDAGHQRDPSVTTTAPIPTNSYCKVPHSDPRIVRGARNDPCPGHPNLRSANAAGCGLIFQKDVVARTQALGDAATYNPSTGRMLAPNGKFYLVDQLAGSKPAPKTWQQFLIGLVKW